MPSTSKFENLTDLFRSLDLSDAQAGVERESRARIALVGPAGAGKSSLYNCLQGWTVSAVQHAERDLYEPVEESLGLFTLIDLPNVVGRSQPLQDYDFGYDYGRYNGPAYDRDAWHIQDPALWSLLDVDLVIFVVDGAAGLRPVDYQWFTRIRAAGCAILVLLNKIDLLGDDTEPVVQDLRQRLALPVLAVSARDGTNVHDALLRHILDMNPSLTVPLGRDVATCRRQAASHLIRQSALACGLLGVEPMPLLDVPFQLLTQMRLVMRLAAMYGRPARAAAGGTATSSARTDALGLNSRNTLGSITSSVSRSVMLALLGGLGLRYAAQQLVKLVPVLGWLVSGLLSASSTWLMGWAAVTYFEKAQAGVPLIDIPGGALGWLKNRHPELQPPQIHLRLPNLSGNGRMERAGSLSDLQLRQRLRTFRQTLIPRVRIPDRLKHRLDGYTTNAPTIQPPNQQTNERTIQPTNTPTNRGETTPC